MDGSNRDLDAFTPKSFDDFSAAAAAPNGLDGVALAGFDPQWREWTEPSIAIGLMDRFTDLLPSGASESPGCLIDIGAGASTLAAQIMAQCIKRSLRYVAVDSAEVLAHIQIDECAEVPHVTIPGRFPHVIDKLLDLPAPRFVLAYSVLQYLRRGSELCEFIEGMAALTEPGGALYLGDLPNADLKSRRLASLGLDVQASNAMHFRDSDLLSIVQSLRQRGLNAYLLPGLKENPLSPHREDVIAVAPPASRGRT